MAPIPIRYWSPRDGVNHLYSAKFFWGHEVPHFEAWGRKFDYNMYQRAFPTHLEGVWTGGPGELPTPAIRFWRSAPPEERV